MGTAQDNYGSSIQPGTLWTLWRCNRCGSAVSEKALHDRWHAMVGEVYILSGGTAVPSGMGNAYRESVD